MNRLKQFLFLILFIFNTLIYSSDFSVSLWTHSSDYSNDKKTAINELNERLSFYKEIRVENLYVFNTLKSEHKKGWDFLKNILKVAHEKGLKVHPAIVSGNRIRVEGKIKKNQDWLIKDSFGKTMPYLNLSNKEVKKYIQKKIRKLLKYDIDGVHLDYIRFPYISSRHPGDSVMSNILRIIRVTLNHFIPDHIYHNVADNYFSYDEKTLSKFDKYYKKNFGDSVKSGEDVLKKWRKWNASNITLLVEGIKKLIKRSGRNIPLSAAVFSNREFAFHSLGQDWGKWGREGVVDTLCPMLYSNDNMWFRERLKGVIETIQKGCEVYAGIAIKSSTNTNTLEGVMEQIRIAREEGADGIVIFSGKSLTEEFGIKIKEAGCRKQADLRNSGDKTGRTPVARNLSPEINFELK